MNRLIHLLPAKAQDDLQALLEPVSSYITAGETIRQQKVAIIAAIVILIEGVQAINASASAYLEARSQDFIG